MFDLNLSMEGMEATLSTAFCWITKLFENCCRAGNLHYVTSLRGTHGGWNESPLASKRLLNTSTECEEERPLIVMFYCGLFTYETRCEDFMRKSKAGWTRKVLWAECRSQPGVCVWACGWKTGSWGQVVCPLAPLQPRQGQRRQKQGFIHLVSCLTLVNCNISGMEFICRCSSSNCNKTLLWCQMSVITKAKMSDKVRLVFSQTGDAFWDVILMMNFDPCQSVKAPIT